MVFIIFFNVEINASVALVGIAVSHNFLYEFLLLYDMSCGMRFNAWRQDIERLHGVVIAISVVLCYLHWLKLLEPCLLLYFVVTFVSIVLKVAHIGDVTDVTNLISEMFQIAEKDVEGDGWTCMAKMRIAIYGWSTYIHAYIRSIQRFEELLSAGKCIINQQILFHNIIYLNGFSVQS